jgi:gamma-glutamylcyclotransferase (GGCT)/AIG2-like uncharacterized protein YtfP
MTDSRPCFAYGSNLCPDTLGAWLRGRGLDASHARLVGPAWLPDHALSFGYRSAGHAAGALDVRPLRGSVVQGALLALSPAGWAALDGKEGVAVGAYARRDTEAIRPDGSVVPAVVYGVTDARRDVHHAPTGTYLRSVEAGYAAWGHDPAPLRRAAAGDVGASWVDAVFVYGTLLRGESNAHVLHDRPVRRVLDARVRGALLETDQPYPVMVLDDASTVHGELVELDDVGARLGPLDALEDFSGYGRPGRLYHRTLVEATTAAGTRRAWTYVAGETVGRGARIESGSWRAHRRRTDVR